MCFRAVGVVLECDAGSYSIDDLLWLGITILWLFAEGQWSGTMRAGEPIDDSPYHPQLHHRLHVLPYLKLMKSRYLY